MGSAAAPYFIRIFTRQKKNFCDIREILFTKKMDEKTVFSLNYKNNQIVLPTKIQSYKCVEIIIFKFSDINKNNKMIFLFQ